MDSAWRSQQTSISMKKRKHSIVQADSPEGQLAGEGIIEAVENQIRDNYPL